MGLFNVLRIDDNCPLCGISQQMEIQFKYGEVRQYQYRLGDMIRPEPGKLTSDEPRAVRSTINCKVCDTKYILCDIHFKGLVITRVTLLPAVESAYIPVTKGAHGRHGRGKHAKGKKHHK
jgi:hypothetical protein